jgi:hypothetical protein
MFPLGKLILKSAMQNQNDLSVIGLTSLTYHPVLSLKSKAELSIEAVTLPAVVMSVMPESSTSPQWEDGECFY